MNRLEAIELLNDLINEESNQNARDKLHEALSVLEGLSGGK